MHYLLTREITEDDIINLVENGVLEDYYIEYKAKAPESNKEKESFLKNICAFANSYGGLLFYGIEQNKKENKLKLVGIDNEKIDDLKLTLKNLIRDSIRPSVKCEILHIPLSKLPGKSVIVIRVYPSYFKPHRMEYKKKREFYWRTTAGVDPMPFEEIRRMFIESATIYDKINEFRKNRIDAIRVGDIPSPEGVMGKSLIVLHLIPTSAFYLDKKLDIGEIGKRLDANELLIFTIRGVKMGGRYNFNGILVYDDYGYVQLYRTGVIEAVDSSILKIPIPHIKSGKLVSPKVKTIPVHKFIARIKKSSMKYLEFLSNIGIDYPIVLFLSLINVEGYSLGGIEWLGKLSKDIIINERDLIIPGVILEKEDDLSEKLKDIFDPVFNACGHPGLEDYTRIEE